MSKKNKGITLVALIRVLTKLKKFCQYSFFFLENVLKYIWFQNEQIEPKNVVFS